MFVRTQIRKDGGISTALIEARRDDQGRPRQKVIANLHGRPTVVDAAAYLTGEQASLKAELEKIEVLNARRSEIVRSLIRIEDELDHIQDAGLMADVTADEIDAAVERYKQDNGA